MALTLKECVYNCLVRAGAPLAVITIVLAGLAYGIDYLTNYLIGAGFGIWVGAVTTCYFNCKKQGL